LNVYFVPTDPRLFGERMEESTLELVRQVRSAISIPLAVKLSPFYSILAHLARELDELGVDALVLFNRFNQPDIDLEAMQVITRPLISHDGDGEALRLPLR
jgi:dihydroorotate dehydrogenase (fumarate)